MDEKLREDLVAAMEKAARAVGARNFDDGMKSATRLVGWFYENMHSIQTTNDVRTALDACPPFSKREGAIVLFLMNRLPQVIRLGFKLAAKKAASDLPALNTGRPPAIPSNKAREALEYVSRLSLMGCSFSVAKLRAAQKFGCDVRTIERLWSQRESVLSDEVIVDPTMDDALDYIFKGE